MASLSATQYYNNRRYRLPKGQTSAGGSSNGAAGRQAGARACGTLADQRVLLVCPFRSWSYREARRWSGAAKGGQKGRTALPGLCDTWRRYVVQQAGGVGRCVQARQRGSSTHTGRRCGSGLVLGVAFGVRVSELPASQVESEMMVGRCTGKLQMLLVMTGLLHWHLGRSHICFFMY